MESVACEFEGALLKHPDPFSYFMLLAFEASGLIRFTILLLLWPVICLLHKLGNPDTALRLSIFIAVAGIREAEIQTVARAVLPKFYMDDLDSDAWNVFSSFQKRFVVTGMPRIMVERFVKEHLRADEVMGAELVVNRFGFATGFVKNDLETDGVATMLRDDVRPLLGMGRFSSSASSFLDTCREKCHPPFRTAKVDILDREQPIPVIFHDGRLVKKPTPSTALIIIIWLPLGIILATIRILLGMMLPISTLSYVSRITGVQVFVKGSPPNPTNAAGGGVLFLCTHRTLMDPVIISTVLGRRIPAVTYSISRLTEILAPIPTVRLTRTREVDAARIKNQLSKGDLVMCPEGTTCREPYLLRFSALFAEMAERIVPVAMNCRVGFFHATTARGWKGLDPFFFLMNPMPTYDVTFLKELAPEATCARGRSSREVAKYVQRLLAATLGFECTDFTRKDKYRLLAGNDGDATTTDDSFFPRGRL